MEPQHMGEYRLIARLGRGGMSDVFLAVRRGQLGISKLVVIKRLREDLTQRQQQGEGIKHSHQEDFSQLLLDEARVCARLHHPNVVQSFEAGVEAELGLPYLAMEYLDGQSLDRVLGMACRERVRLPITITLRIICDVLAALDYAHTLRDYDGTALGIVHRDVSPHNIFLTYQGEVKLVDFGVAKHVWCSDQTAVGVVKGKLTYMAPEQAKRGVIDQRADLFAAGIVLWECLAMRRLLAADSPASTLAKLLYEPLPALASVQHAIDPALSEICARALQRDPDARYASAAAMRAELEQRSALRAASQAELASFVSQLFQREREQRAQQLQDALAGEHILNLNEQAPTAVTAASKLTVAPQRRSVTGHTPISVTAPVRRDASSIASIAMVVMAACVLLASVLWASEHTTSSGAPAAVQAQPIAGMGGHVPAAHSGMETEAVLRLCGSNTIGAELAPALVEGFLAEKGATQVTRHRSARSDLSAVTASVDNKPLSVEIAANGSATAFTGLQAGTCDVGMASRAIEEAEVEALYERGLGDMRLPGAEHVIALDGIAVIVHPNNPLRSLDRATLRAIYTGELDNWSTLGGLEHLNAPIHVLSRDGKSGTFDTFRHLVLGKDALSPGATLFAQNDALADKVASDPYAIGFVGLAYVRVARALAVSESGAPPMLPTQFTVATEGYMLSRRLYLYTPPNPKTRSSWIPEFVSFALSHRAQEITAHSGFVDLSVLTSPDRCPASGENAPSHTPRCTAEYAASVAGAQRVSIDFRFRRGNNDLDSRAARDLDRLVAFMHDHPQAKLRLFGFADAIGGAVSNQKLSLERARTIANELALRGVEVAVIKGLGAQMPVASNETDAGRQRNRRVEAWVELQR